MEGEVWVKRRRAVGLAREQKDGKNAGKRTESCIDRRCESEREGLVSREREKEEEEGKEGGKLTLNQLRELGGILVRELYEEERAKP